jgi:hypothetical protein
MHACIAGSPQGSFSGRSLGANFGRLERRGKFQKSKQARSRCMHALC